MSTHYPSFYSHHYEKCDGEEDEHDLTVTENRLTRVRFDSISLFFLLHSTNDFRFQQPTDGARDQRMGRVPGPAYKGRLRVDGQPSVHGNNGKDTQNNRLRSNIHLGSVRGRHCKR